ncbi:hypothetical protein [Spirosoma panaciterrae]|uniref:hypothetical protein n=1 Tax=Spirosoma panaciterrae TaxID=496058 RepID=UPI000361CD77|nr:hypothetical protein [Spirosoma panaciterrae]
MDYIASLLPDLAKQSITAAVLFVIWVITWRYFTARQEKSDEIAQKKDEAIFGLVNDHSEKLLVVQEKTLESNGILNTTLVKLGDKLDSNHQQVLRELDDLKPKKNGTVRPLINRTTEPAESIAKA